MSLISSMAEPESSPPISTSEIPAAAGISARSDAGMSISKRSSARSTSSATTAHSPSNGKTAEWIVSTEPKNRANLSNRSISNRARSPLTQPSIREKVKIMKRKLRMGMVGGGQGAFIGAVHRAAAALDGKIELVAGAFSSDPKRSQESGAELFLDPERVYPDFQSMAEREAELPAEQRIDFVSIVTPNHTHFEIASTFLKAGFNIICDKPMTMTLAEARELQNLVKKSGKVFAMTHNYTG